MIWETPALFVATLATWKARKTSRWTDSQSWNNLRLKWSEWHCCFLYDLFQARRKFYYLHSHMSWWMKLILSRFICIHVYMSPSGCFSVSSNFKTIVSTSLHESINTRFMTSFQVFCFFCSREKYISDWDLGFHHHVTFMSNFGVTCVRGFTFPSSCLRHAIKLITWLIIDITLRLVVSLHAAK